MATEQQLFNRLKEKRIDAYWALAQKHGFEGTREEWLEIAEEDIDVVSQADAEAIFAFLTEDIRVKAGIEVATAVASGIGGYVVGSPTTRIITDEEGSGSGQTTNQGYLE